MERGNLSAAAGFGFEKDKFGKTRKLQRNLKRLSYLCVGVASTFQAFLVRTRNDTLNIWV